MRRASSVLLALLVLAAAPARGHDVPIAPSACAVEPLEIALPARGLAAVAEPAGAVDALRTVYDTGTSRAVFCPADPADPQGRCADPVPRPFALGGTDGSLAFPASFAARMLDSGDLTTTELPLALAVGGTEAVLRIALTTGLAAAGDLVVQGAPLGGDGRFVLVGVAADGALPPPFDGGPVVLRLGCATQPPPDLDQFSLAVRTGPLRGRLTGAGGRLRTVMQASAAPPDFAGRPAIVQVRGGGEVLASLHVPEGLAPRGRRRFVAGGDGGTIKVARKGRAGRHVLSIRVASSTLPVAEARQAPVELAFDLGGALGRSAAVFRANRAGTRFRAR